MKKKTKSLLEVHGAIFLFGFTGLFGKLVSLPAPLIVLGRVFFALVVLGAFLGFSKGFVRLKTRRDLSIIAFGGIMMALHWIALFYSIKISTVAVGLLGAATFPVFTTFLEPLVSKRRIERHNVLLAFVTLFGVSLILPSVSLDSSVAQGMLWGILSGFFFAAAAIANRICVRKYPSQVISFYQNAVITVFLLPCLYFVKTTYHASDIAWLIVLGVIFTAGSHTLFIKGMVRVKAQTASIIASLEPVYGVLCATLFLGERPTARVIVAGMVIAAATLLASIDVAAAGKRLGLKRYRASAAYDDAG